MSEDVIAPSPAPTRRTTSNGPPIRLTDPEWFARLGQVARAVGTDSFHEKLVGLFGSVIAHDSVWIIRYSRRARPDVLFTSKVPAHIVDFYQSKYCDVDPFSHHWRTSARPGVLTLRKALTPSPESEIYAVLFAIKARISDEMAMFFPVIGHSCVALFIEREEGYFSAAEEERARLVFPALEGLHRSHLGRLFYDLKNTSETDARGPITLPTLILDRLGTQVYASRTWREAEKAEPAIAAAIAALKDSPARDMKIADDLALRVEVFERDFALAPGGRMMVLERIAAAPDVGRRIDQSLSGIGKITRRERDILALVLRGRTTGQIAQELGISKGTIKNYRLRIYRKANVTSERALVSLLMPLMDR